MGVFYPVRVQKNDPNKGRKPFDSKGNDNSVPVPGHPDWAGRKRRTRTAVNSANEEPKKPRG